MALDDLLATLERQAGTAGTAGVPADVPAKPLQTLGGTAGTAGTAENEKGKEQAEAFIAWALRFAEDATREVWLSPPASRDEVMTLYPSATAAEPVSLPPIAQSCRACRHLKRPGLSDGLCGKRDDLPHAYTPGHPLRRLPDDQGANCASYESNE